MKTSTILTSVLLGAFIASVGTASAHAAVIPDQKQDTKTAVTINDNSQPTDPTKPGEKNLTLDNAPTNYNFKTKLQHDSYSIDSGDISGESINVFNDTVARDWSVKANVVNNQLSRSDSKTFPVTTFKINDQEIAATGATGIVAQAATDKTDANNTGLIKTPVSSISIGFTDANKDLKVGDTINGDIQYQLYNTPDAQ